MMTASDAARVQLRLEGDRARPVVVYLPGLHGDWTLAGRFRAALGGRLCLAELSYPRTVEWSLAEYAQAVCREVREAGLSRLWLLAESFGSQVAWAVLELEPEARGFEVAGLVLAGGFVRHPAIWGVRWTLRVHTAAPGSFLRPFLVGWARLRGARYPREPEVRLEMEEFLRRRAEPGDREAILHRYSLIQTSDYRPVARRASTPVFLLAGLADAVVPWPWVWWWVRRNCPAYRGTRFVWWAHHHILGCAPRECADAVVEWVASTGA